jgi:uncharacterized membrane protein
VIRATTVAIGILLTVLGVLGVIPVFHEPWSADAPRLDVRNARGFTFGLIPNNLVITLFHLFAGLAGLFAAALRRGTGTYLRASSIIFGGLAVLGVMPPTSTLFGVMPLFGFNMWTHMIVAVVAAWIGWPLARDPDEEINWEDAADSFKPGLNSVASVAGRPVHPMLVMYPVSFVTGALVTDLSYWWTTLDWYNGYVTFWPRASLWLLAACLATGGVAAIVGSIDFFGVRRLRSIRTARSHATAGFALLVLVSINLSLRFGDPASHIIPWGISISAVSVILMGVAAWHGTSLTYRYRVGVRRYGWIKGDHVTSGSPASQQANEDVA